jgi:uncharacterized protein (TIGR02186 family)
MSHAMMGAAACAIPRAIPRALRRGLIGFFALVALAASPTPARAQALVADLSDHFIAITTGFIGTDVLLFGAIEGDGDVVVVLRGPAGRELVRRKSRIAGIFVNDREVPFLGVPTFYSVSSNRPLDEILSPSVRMRHEIGFDTLRFVPEKPADAANPALIEEFRSALIRNKQRAELYVEDPGKVVFLGARLFRTRVYFPSTLPTGSYTADVYLVRGGQVISAQSTPLIVSKVGFGATVFDFAYGWPMAYGVLAVLVALLAGWLAALAFRRT